MMTGMSLRATPFLEEGMARIWYLKVETSSRTLSRLVPAYLN